MKKLIMMAAAALLFVAPAAQAQRVNQEAIRAKLAKSDADIADAKKSAKAATWISRGKAYLDAASEPTRNIFAGMEAPMLKLAVGDALSMQQETLNGTQFDVLVYPYFKAYVRDGKLAAWWQTREVGDNLIDEAIAAYAKAYDLDPKSATKIKDGLKQISDFCSQVGNSHLDLGNSKLAAEAYAKAYEAQSVPAFGGADPELLFYAGYLETVNGANDPASFVLGADYLKRAIEQGYDGEDGVSYYYLFHCYYGQKDADRANLQKAKQALLDGMAKYPQSERLIDGLMSLYTAEEGVGDPADLIAMIEEAIARDPQNVDMWFGRGRIYAALKNHDECIASFRRVTELNPEGFDGWFWTGWFHIEKGNALNDALNEKPWTGEAAYNEELKAVNAVYMQAVPWLEKALELKPDDLNTVDYLKSLSFRLRDEEGMMDKYNKYNALLQSLQQ